MVAWHSRILTKSRSLVPIVSTVLARSLPPPGCLTLQFYLFTGNDPFDESAHLFAMGPGIFLQAVMAGARPAFPDDFAQPQIKTIIESCWKPVDGGRPTVEALATKLETAAKAAA